MSIFLKIAPPQERMVWQKVNRLDAGSIKWPPSLTTDQILKYPYLRDAMQMCYFTYLQTTVLVLEQEKSKAIETEL